MFGLVAALLLQVHVPGVSEHRITDIFKPLASPAEAEKSIALLTLSITGLIFVVVASLIAYTIWRYRRRADDDSHQEPPQVYGSNQIEAAWTVIPLLIVFVLIGVSARVIAQVENASPPRATLHATIIGHQWWWEVRYPDYGIVTANEIHVPAAPDGSQATYIKLSSADVNHSFWVPELAGKMDLIANRDNYTWINPKQTGEYLGNCSQYCGTQHAQMFLRVIAQSPEDFRKWAAAQQKPANDAPDLAQAKATFESLSCANCHMVRGTSAAGKFGPDLTHLMSRHTIGSGVLTNTNENLRAWVNNPQDAKPGCFMPSMKLTKSELDQVVTYLESLN